MPPLELTCNSHYALENSEEADDLCRRAEEGKFNVYRAIARADGSKIGYLIFESLDEQEQTAVAAFAMEMDQPVSANLVYEPRVAKTRRSVGLLGRLGLHR